MRIKSTTWAKNFKRECPHNYDDAIAFASYPNLKVKIIRNNELDESVWMYSIAVDVVDFWMESLPTHEEAVKLCNKMNWSIINDASYIVS